MILTVDSHRANNYSLLAAKGEYYWGAAEICLYQPWFLVTILETEDRGCEIKRTMLIFDVEGLIDLSLRAISRLWTLLSVELITPGHMNGTGTWQMQGLSRIEEYTDPSCEAKKAKVFTTTDGSSFVVSSSGTQLADLTEPVVRFSAP